MSTEVLHHHSSVDPEEVARYAALADTWWDKTGPFWPLHRLNELRAGYLRHHLSRAFERDPQAERPLADLSVLDIGCGGGLLSESMAASGAEVHGIDVVERNIAVARLHAERSGLDIRYQAVAAEALARQGAEYDVVLNMEVVEHVADLAGFVHACARLVKPGGLMVIATINRTFPAWLTAIVGAEYVLGWLPRGTHQWHRFVKPRELKALWGENAIQPIARTGVRVNPFTRQMALTRFMGVNYMLVGQKQAQAVQFRSGP